MSNKKLHVHHKQYIKGLKAWEYEDRYLVTLCDRCHFLYEIDLNPNLLDKPNKYDKDDVISLIEYLSEVRIRTPKQSVKIFTYHINDILGLNKSTYELLFYIIYNLRYQKTLVYLTPKETGMNKQTFYNCVNELIENNILDKIETHFYRVNKKYFYNGKSEWFFNYAVVNNHPPIYIISTTYNFPFFYIIRGLKNNTNRITIINA